MADGPADPLLRLDWEGTTMRRIIAILGVLALGTVGCKHVGGKCDCGPTPGEHALYAPMQGYPAAPGSPVMAPTAEAIGSPKMMQMPR